MARGKKGDASTVNDAVQSEKKKRGRPKKEKTTEVVEKAKDNSTREVEHVKAEKVKGGVGGNGNLIPLTQRTKEEQREIRTKAGVASGIARRQKKELREFTRDFLMQDAAPVLKGNMQVLGVESDQLTNLAAMVVRLFNKAVNQGDLNSARTLIEWAGMAPLQQERENEAIAKMVQVMQLADGSNTKSDDDMDVIFYIPNNGRPIITEEDMVVADVGSK